jgi:death-on-curing protein
MDVVYLTPAEVVALHQHMMRRMGWRPAPLRSEDLLESAVQRAQAAAYYGGADLVEQACVLAVGISQNQPFLDGNKRTALYCLIVFLRRNGVRFTGPRLEIAQQLIDVAERSGSLEEATARFAGWVRERTVAINQD